MRRQDIDGRAAPQKIQNHLGRNSAGIGADPFGTDPMIRSEGKDHSAGKLGVFLPDHGGIADRQFFQPSEAVYGFRELIHAGLRTRPCRKIYRSDRRNGFLQCHSVHYFRRSDWPQITTWTSSAAAAKC
jgi:hypothetical protein